jgi:predicted nucleic acid-binding protein
MTMPFVDTDIIIRLLTGDDVAKQAAAQALFDAVAAGQMTVAAPDTIIADAVFVLGSPYVYKLPRPQIRDMLAPLVALPHLRLPNRRILLRALDVYAATRLDFGDAMLVASMEQRVSTKLFSWDREFDRVPGIQREEPALAMFPPVSGPEQNGAPQGQ